MEKNSLKPSILNKDIAKNIIRLFLFFLTAIFLLEIIFSLKWRMGIDFPIMHYVSFLVDRHDFVLYRDIFEKNMPGTILFHLFLGHLIGYGDGIGFAVANIVWLLVFLTVTWGIMRFLGLYVAWASVVLFGLSYYEWGPYMSLQRDCVALLPISLSLLILFYNCFPNWIRHLFIGLLFGISATIKPHLCIGFPIVFLFQILEYNKNNFRRIVKYGLVEVVGFLVPVLACLFWVWHQGGLNEFLEISKYYTPLYLNITHYLQLIDSSQTLKYIVEYYLKLGGYGFLLIPAVLGLYISLFGSDLNFAKKKKLFLLVLLLFVYSLYPVISGQFFQYHWMPFKYFLILLVSATLVHISKKNVSSVQKLFPLVVFIAAVILSIKLPYDFYQQIKGLPPSLPKWGRVDEMAQYLNQNLKPGDKVQPLDWTGGAVHAMLLSRAELATSFLEDVCFYHNISEPYIQSLREKFLLELKQSKPKFIIEVFEDKPWVLGVDTTTSFDSLWEFILKNYDVASEGWGYHIWKLKV